MTHRSSTSSPGPAAQRSVGSAGQASSVTSRGWPLRLLLAALAVLLVSACSTSQPSGSTSQSSGNATDGGATAVRIGVLKSSLNTVIDAIAQDGGYYTDQGLDVNRQNLTSGQGSILAQQLLAGRIDLAFGVEDEVLRADSEAIKNGTQPPLALVALGVPGITNLVLAGDQPYSTLQDLKGLRLGVSSLASSHLVNFRYFLAEHGLTTEQLQLKLIAMSGADMPATLAAGQIDGFLHSEPVTSIAVTKVKAKVVLSANQLGVAGLVPGTGVAVNREWASKNPDTVRRFVTALMLASDNFAKISEADVIKIYVDYIGADAGLMKEVYKRVNPRILPLRQEADALWKVVVPGMKESGQISPDLQLKDVIDYSYWDQANAKTSGPSPS